AQRRPAGAGAQDSARGPDDVAVDDAPVARGDRGVGSVAAVLAVDAVDAVLAVLAVDAVDAVLAVDAVHAVVAGGTRLALEAAGTVLTAGAIRTVPAVHTVLGVLTDERLSALGEAAERD